MLNISKLFIFFFVATNRMKKENFYYIINSLLYMAIIHEGWNHNAGIFIPVTNYEHILINRCKKSFLVHSADVSSVWLFSGLQLVVFSTTVRCSMAGKGHCVVAWKGFPFRDHPHIWISYRPPPKKLMFSVFSSYEPYGLSWEPLCCQCAAIP